MDSYLLNFGLAFVIAAIATPLCRLLAIRWGIVDHPGYRKIHHRAMPLLGGLAIYLGFLITTLIDGRDAGSTKILVGSSVILILGLLDDKYAMGARVKFLLPSIAALVLIYLGIETVFLPETFHNILNILFSFFWILGIVNAFNIIDNMDGLSSGVACISALAFGVLGLLTSQYTVAVLSFSLAGACLGFLLFNFHPARIFAGDAGSMFMGFTLATIAIYASWESTNLTTSLLMPILALGYPIYDIAFVTILRTLHRKPFWIGDANHTSHRLVKLGFSQRAAVLLLYLLSFGLALTAVIINAVTFSAALLVLGVVVFLLLTISLILAKVPFVWRDGTKN